MTEKNIMLDVSADSEIRRISACRGDTESRTFIFILHSGGKIISLSDGMTVLFRAEIGGETYVDACEIVSGKAAYTLKSSFTSIAGCHPAELAVYKGAGEDMQVLYCTGLELEICDTLEVSDEIAADDRFLVLDTLINRAEAAAAEAEATLEAIENYEYDEGGVKTVLSDNLFDKTTATRGMLFYHDETGPQLITGLDMCYAYVPLRGAGTYRTKVNYANHGNMYSHVVPILKEDKSFLMNVTGTVTPSDDENAYDIEFVITQDMVNDGAALYAFDVWVNCLDSIMIVKDREYPDTYIPYGYITVAAEYDGELGGKVALFFGDSICAGTTVGDTAPEYGWGWGGLIGDANGMAWSNFALDGAVITDIEGQTRIVADQIDTALSEFAEADYIIFEGGTNDADQLGAGGLGEISDDYATFDTSTFTGALEALISKILTVYPNAKIGYIVAQKMGIAPYTSDGSVRRQYFDRAVEICRKWGVPYIDLWESSPLNPMLPVHYDSSLTADEANEAGKYYTDGQHLTLAGYQRVAPQIEAFMRRL